MTSTFGPAYSEELDGKRIRHQHEAIRDFMLDGRWRTLQEIAKDLGYPESSVSAQLRHLRKPEFGAYIVEKRRRISAIGTWEYHVEARIINSEGQCEMFRNETIRPGSVL